MVRYKMLGKDVDFYPDQYRTWVNETPDLDGITYTGLKSGDTDLQNIKAYQIQDGYAVVDFNMPDPTSWQTALQTLPLTVFNSQLAIINDKAYLFGGDGYNKILSADAANPVAWEVSESVLPTILSNSQFAIVDDFCYLFGGKVNITKSLIYRAPVTDPLTWTDTGQSLPSDLEKSQLAIVGDSLYLYGGLNNNLAQSSIFQADLSDPLTWVDTGDNLPSSLFGSQVAIVDDYIYLLGGFRYDGYATDSIYRASVNTPTSFTSVGNLPFAGGYGQFFTVGRTGYLISNGNYIGEQPYLTRILSCDLDDPLDWEDTGFTISGNVTQSQVAIIEDRVFLFGGNSSTLIFMCDQIIKYPFETGTDAEVYGSITRTQYQAVADPTELNALIGYPWWKNNYKQ